VPPNITLVPLPAKAPELNPVENIWQYLSAHSRDGDRWLHTIMITRSSDRDHCQR
jgi:transposase